MKTTLSHLGIVALASLIMTGCISGLDINRMAVVRYCRSETYSKGGSFEKLKPSMKCAAGTVIQSAEFGKAWLQINGAVSTVMLREDTTLELTRMDHRVAVFGGDSTTVLTLTDGTIWGRVGKLADHSSFEIHTPDGVASIRGGDFVITVERDLSVPSWPFVTYQCVAGELVVTSARGRLEDSTQARREPVTRVLEAGQEWFPSVNEVMKISDAILESLKIKGPIFPYEKPVFPPSDDDSPQPWRLSPRTMPDLIVTRFLA